MLEIKRTSITRLKQYESAVLPIGWQGLEIKRTSITRLKRAVRMVSQNSPHNLKSKEPRLRDWNRASRRQWGLCKPSWNQKNLDYEIETWRRLSFFGLRHRRLKSKEPRLRDWNKNLESLRNIWPCTFLEIKRTSITRLKHKLWIWYNNWIRTSLKSKEPRLRDWNMGEKAIQQSAEEADLKSKEPRLRDWNGIIIWRVDAHALCLKSKEPRLRDWNNVCA